MKKEDLIYKDKEFEIYKKHSGLNGTIIPLDCLELIEIMVSELEGWNNAGFAQKEDYERIIDDICSKLRNTIKK